jgi:signal peptidase I
MKKVAVYTGYAVIFLFICIAVFIYMAPHLGWRVDAVNSGSMEPELKVGSVVIIKPEDPENIVIGDIITFRIASIDNTLATHRVIDIKHGTSLYFQTKGDANLKADPFIVSGNDLIGKLLFNIKGLGPFIDFLKTIYGFLLTVILPGAVLLVIYALNVWREINQKNKHDQSGD